VQGVGGFFTRKKKSAILDLDPKKDKRFSYKSREEIRDRSLAANTVFDETPSPEAQIGRYPKV